MKRKTNPKIRDGIYLLDMIGMLVTSYQMHGITQEKDITKLHQQIGEVAMQFLENKGYILPLKEQARFRRLLCLGYETITIKKAKP